MQSAYVADRAIELHDLMAPARRVRAVDALGRAFEAVVDGQGARLGPLEPATYRIEALSGESVLGRELTTVEAHPASSPVPAFATSLASPDEAAAVAAFARRLRATVVQVYDWMASYSQPAPPADLYTDPLGRRLSRPALVALNAAIRAQGAVSEAYAPVYGADPPAAEALPDLRLYGPDGTPQRLADLVAVMHPGRSAWIERWLGAWAVARDLGFGGFHLDTYGYPHAAVDADGRPVDMADAFTRFLAAVRTAFPDFLLTFNQVNTHPAGLRLVPPPSARYVEVWPPNDGWRHLEGVLARAGARPDHATILAIYPTVWRQGVARADALRTAMLTEAVVTALGADVLIWGDDRGALCDPYYPRHTRLTDEEADRVVALHRFALGVRDLLRRGRDTSWEDVGGVNRAVIVEAASPVSPEPLGGHLFARVRRGRGWLAVSLVDLTGSAHGRWTEPAAAGVGGGVTVSVALPEPGRWRAEAASAGVAGGAFRPLALRVVPHDEGTALAVDLADVHAWSVVRLSTDGASW